MAGFPGKSLLSSQTHHAIYFAGLCILAAAMPTSRFVMSLVQILMGVNWLFEGNYKEKGLRFVRCKPAVVFSLIYVIHIVGLLWSTDLAYGVGSDLKNKLPMLTLTFMVASSRPLNTFKIHFLLYIFFAAVLVTSFIGFYIYITESYVNFRHISPFVSHVYFSMMIIMTIVTLPWLTQKITSQKKWLWVSVGVSAWLFVFLFILRSMTGLLCLGGVMIFLTLRYLQKTRLWVVKVLLASFILAIVVIGFWISSTLYQKISLEIDPVAYGTATHTALGTPYTHKPQYTLRENGYFVYYFIAEEELRQAWNERSDLDFDGKDLKGNPLNATLYRYMSGMGLKKDRASLEQLEHQDIRAIERGVANHYYTQWPGMMVRLHQTLWEIYWYLESGNPTGHTFTQRLELWKGSWIAFTEKPLLGWGTGDIFIAVRHGLETIDSPMENYHMKPHNQYLLFLLTLGIAGSFFIYGMYFYFARITKAYKHLPFNVFVLIMLVSMLGNNPIDAQAGQTFFTFFTLYFGILMHRVKIDPSKAPHDHRPPVSSPDHQG